MSTIQHVMNGEVLATSYVGLGSGLTGIPRTGLLLGSANHVLVNDGAGNLTSTALLGPKLGGTGLDTSNANGIPKMTAGVWSVGSTISDGDISNTAAIQRSKLATGTPNQLVVNDASGNLISVANLSTSLGGTGQNLSAVTGPAIATVTNGAFAANLVYSSSAVANSVVQRDGSAGISGALVTATSVSTPNIVSAGDLTLNPTGGNLRLGGTIINQQPSTIVGGNTAYYTSNITTTNSTSTNIFSLSTTSGTKGTIYSARVHIVAGDSTGGSNSGSFSYYVRAKNLLGTLTATSQAGLVQNLDMGFLVSTSVAVSGTSLQFRVTGLAGTTINWCAHLEVVQQTF